MPQKVDAAKIEYPESLDYRDGNLVVVYKRWHDGKLTIIIPLTDEVREKIKRGEK